MQNLAAWLARYTRLDITKEGKLGKQVEGNTDRYMQNECGFFFSRFGINLAEKREREKTEGDLLGKTAKLSPSLLLLLSDCATDQSVVFGVLLLMLTTPT